MRRSPLAHHSGRASRRRALALAVLGAVLAGLPGGIAPASAAPPGFVTASGTTLELDGQPYRFTGINVYNATNASGCWYPMASGSTLDDSLTAISASGGPKVMRSWFFQALATTGGVRDWSGFDHTLAVAAAHGTKVIVTLGNQWIDCDGPAGGAGSFKDEAWYTGGYAQPDPGGTVSYRDWVAEIVARYKDDPTILAWQLMNEAEVKPSAGSGSCSVNAAGILKSFAADVSGLIKSIDPNHLVSLGTIGGGQCGAQGAEYQDVHDVSTIDLCEYHDYGSPNTPMPGDQWNGLQVRLDQCRALGKPLFVGETGIRSDQVASLQARADAFRAKLYAQFDGGVAGELAWAWNKDGSVGSYDIGPGDPTLALLDAFVDGPPPGPSAGSPFGHAIVGYGNGTGKLLRVDGPSYVRQTTLNWGGGPPSIRADGLIAATDFEGPHLGISVQHCNGTGQRRLTDPSTARDEYPDFSPDGTWIAYSNATTGNLYEVNADGSGTPQPLTSSGMLDQMPAFSPDGTKIAFWRNYGNSGLYVLDLDTRVEARIVANAGQYPEWTPDGTRIVFVRAFDAQVWIVHADGSDGLDPFTDHPERKLTFASSLSHLNPEISPDGNTLLVSYFSGAAFGTLFIGLNGTHPPGYGIPGNVIFGVWAPDECDVMAPAVVFTTPAPVYPGYLFSLNEAVLSDFACVDEAGGSGVVSCAGPGGATTGSVLDTSTRGGHAFAVTSRDNAGNSRIWNAEYYVYREVVKTPGSSITSDGEGDGATPSDPLETTVTHPGGTVTLLVEDDYESDMSDGARTVSQYASVTGDAATPSAPAELAFTADASEVPADVSATTVRAYVDDTMILDCAGPPGEASPDPCVAERLVLPGGDVRITVRASNPNRQWNVAFAPPNPDADGDGVANAIDVGDGAFDDGAGTVGSIVQPVPAGLTVLVEDLPAPDGVRITVSGSGTGKASFSVCGFPGTLKLAAGSVLELACGSVILAPRQGVAELELFGGATVVSVPQGGKAEVSETSGGGFSVANRGAGAVTVTTGGSASTVQPGQTGPAVTPAGVCALTRQYVQGSAAYQALSAKQREKVDKQVDKACTELSLIAPNVKPNKKAAALKGYEKDVDGLVKDGWLTVAQAATLKALARSL